VVVRTQLVQQLQIQLLTVAKSCHYSSPWKNYCEDAKKPDLH